jgi:ribosome biogenesis GTPase
MIGQVVKINSGFYDIFSDGKIYRTRGSGNLREKSQNPLVGDQVKFNPDGFLYEILERKNFLIRPKVANIDQVVIVTALCEPKFSSFILDKFLAIIEFQGIKPVILFTKADLTDDKIFRDYLSQGYDVVKISNTDESQDYSQLTNLLKNKLSVFTGQSGAGKSTTIKIMAGLNNDFDGNLLINGLNVKTDVKARAKLCYIPDKTSFPLNISSYDFLYQLALLVRDDKEQIKIELDE